MSKLCVHEEFLRQSVKRGRRADLPRISLGQREAQFEPVFQGVLLAADHVCGSEGFGHFNLRIDRGQQASGIRILPEALFPKYRELQPVADVTPLLQAFHAI